MLILIGLLHLLHTHQKDEHCIVVMVLSSYITAFTMRHSVGFELYKQNKMNNNKGSSVSRTSSIIRKPEGFRIMMKQRTNHRQPPQQYKRISEQSMRASASQLVKSQDLPLTLTQANRSYNYSEMQQYVRNRMKTEYGASFAGNRTAKSFKGGDENKGQSPAKSSREQILSKKCSLSMIQKEQVELQPYQTVQSEQRDGTAVEDLGVLERKIESLLERRLDICAHFKKDRDEIVESELEKMVGQLRDLRKQDPETIQAQIAYFDKKVKLFQRLMAESMTESEIIKKDYLAKLSNRSNHRRLKTEFCAPLTRKLSFGRYNQTAQRSVVVNASTTRQVFKAPDPSAYNIYRYKNTFFNADRHKQPLPRSSYNRQFLVNPQTIDREILPFDNEFIGRTNSAQFLQTSYQASFVPKKVDRIDVRGLDACRNKIRDLPVRFGREREKVVVSDGYNILMSKLREQPVKRTVGQVVVGVRPALSESRRAYGKGGVSISSQIKHQNLNKLRYEYKRKMKL